MEIIEIYRIMAHIAKKHLQAERVFDLSNSNEDYIGLVEQKNGELCEHAIIYHSVDNSFELEHVMSLLIKYPDTFGRYRINDKNLLEDICISTNCDCEEIEYVLVDPFGFTKHGDKSKSEDFASDTNTRKSEERYKALCRRIIKMIHPDLNPYYSEHKEEYKDIKNEAMVAYEKKDEEHLEKIAQRLGTNN